MRYGRENVKLWLAAPGADSKRDAECGRRGESIGTDMGGYVKIFISGGCKNGKSYYAQNLAKALASDAPLYYIATMRPADDEDEARITRHRQAREGRGFTTIEQGADIGNLAVDFSGSFLLDSVTALLANEMFRPGKPADEKAYLRVADELVRLADKCGNIVFVSDHIYSDSFQYAELTELYRKGLARIDRALAQACDLVLEVSYGNIRVWKDSGNDFQDLSPLMLSCCI